MRLRNNKGITMIILVITIVILLIISAGTIRSYRTTVKSTDLNRLIADINLLNDKILLYYNQYNKLPVYELPESLYFPDTLKGKMEIENDGGEFFVIDINKLENLSLNFGTKSIEDRGEEEIDIYIINNKTFNIYYVRGIEYEGAIYHKIP